MSDVLDTLDAVVVARQPATAATWWFAAKVTATSSRFDISGAVHAAAADATRACATRVSLSDDRRMLLAVDVGNTQTHLGAFDGEELVRDWRLGTVQSATADELAGTISRLLELDDLSFESLGRHRIRDCAGWTEVFQLCGPALPHDFPPLVTLDTGLPPIATIVMLDGQREPNRG
jgi:hypothetical protein